MRRLIVLAPLALAACAADPPHRDAMARAAIADHCGACHRVPGVAQATGRVGPDLAGIGQQQVIAGQLPNSRANMMLWITHAQLVSPGSVMPNIALSPAQADAVADYLYSLD